MLNIDKSTVSQKAQELGLGPFFEDTAYFYINIIKMAMPKYSGEQLSFLLRTVTMDEIKLLYKKIPKDIRNELPGNEDLLHLPYRTRESVIKLIHAITT